MYQSIIEMKGIPVCFVAYNGDYVVRLFKKKHNPGPCVVIMDYRMPMVNRVEATMQIIEMDSGTKVIFISADDGIREDAIKAGATRFMQKPASVSEILAAVEDVGSGR